MNFKIQNPAAWTIIGMCVFGVASVVLIWQYEAFLSGHYVMLLLTGFFVTLFFFFAIVVFCQATEIFNGFSDFLIGDEGGLSVSRLQAAAWAVVIISYQLSILILLGCKNLLGKYELVFSEQTMWLLGLSLGSYVSVKGVAVSRIQQEPTRYKSKTPKAMDLITGDNGLDFSKFQMLIWTIIALFVFESKCYLHLEALNKADDTNISVLFETTLDEYTAESENTPDNANTVPVPYLPWSFVVLMGLSQGAYVGKKLVPSFKLDELREAKVAQLAEFEADLTQKQLILQNLVTITAANSVSSLDKLSILSQKKHIKDVETKIIEVKREIKKLEGFAQ